MWPQPPRPCTSGSPRPSFEILRTHPKPTGSVGVSEESGPLLADEQISQLVENFRGCGGEC